MSDIRKLSIVPVPPSTTEEHPRASTAEEHARAETARKQRLFDWANKMLEQLGLAERVPDKPGEFRLRANTVDALRKLVFEVNAAEVLLMIRDALHPVSGSKAEHFKGISGDALKAVLRLRFNELKKEREIELSRGHGAAGGTQSAFDWVGELILDKNSAVKPVLANLVAFLRFHPTWKDVLSFDEFAVRVVIRKSPPWGTEASDTLWSDHHDDNTRIWFQKEGVFANLGDVGRAVQTAARYNVFHPVRVYFDALVWDRKPRLDTWLRDYFHVEDSDYVRAIGPRWLISAVARVFKPGCQADHTLILEGQQGQLKSVSLRELAIRDEWFTDRISHVATKDAALELLGVLIAEFGELNTLMQASASASKSFLTRPFDRLRPPYGRHLVRVLRQCVFAGSINPPVGGYLKDSTGNRRFWPVYCHGRIDIEGIRRDRDQLWAEAVHRFKAGEVWWLETAELEALATAEQRARLETDIWQAPIEEWLTGQKDVSITEVLNGAIGLDPKDPKDRSQSAVIRVSKILTKAGFVQVRARIKGEPKSANQREYRYRREIQPKTQTTTTTAKEASS